MCDSDYILHMIKEWNMWNKRTHSEEWNRKLKNIFHQYEKIIACECDTNCNSNIEHKRKV